MKLSTRVHNAFRAIAKKAFSAGFQAGRDWSEADFHSRSTAEENEVPQMQESWDLFAEKEIL